MDKKLKKRFDAELKVIKHHFKTDGWDLDYSLIVDQILMDLSPSLYNQFLNSLRKAKIRFIYKDKEFLLTKEKTKPVQKKKRRK